MAKLYSEATAQKMDKAIEDLLQKQYKSAVDIVKKNKKELDLIVEALLIAEVIVREEIEYIHKHKKLPETVLKLKKSLNKEEKEKKN
jgi:cell division protease FtsH